MAVFEQFPYSNFHDLNLDWVLNEIKSFAARLDGYEGDLADMQQQLNRFPEEFTEEFTQVIYRILNEEWGELLPAVTIDDDGKVLAVVGGVWDKADIPDGNLPPVTYIDAGKVLRVSNVSAGWYAASMDDYTGKYEILTQYPQYNGVISSTGTWSSTGVNTYRHIVIPVLGGETIKLVGNTSRTTYYAAIQSHSLPLTGDVAFATGWTSRKTLSANAIVYETMPEDAAFLYLTVAMSNNNVTPSKVIIDGYTLTSVSVADGLVDYLDGHVADASRNVVNIFNSLGVPAMLLWEHGTIKVSDGIGNPIALQTSTSRLRTAAFQTSVELHVYPAANWSVQAIYVDDDGPTANLSALNPNQPAHRELIIPAGSKFRLIAGYTAGGSVENVDPETMPYIVRVLFTKLRDELYPGLVNWTALGDSITQGYYSYMNGETPASALDPSIAWATLVSTWNKWALNNLGVGGSGFLDPDSHNVAGWQVARDSDFTSANLVTIAYGINDWKGNQPLGEILSTVPSTPTTVIGAMQYTIVKIMQSNPETKIVGILPLNSSDYGSFDSKWALNTANANNVTLEQFVQALIDVYEYYGIEYIDLTHSSVVNRLNIQSLLIDGVHPSISAHRLLALELSKRISFKS